MLPAGAYSVRSYNPRDSGAVRAGSVQSVKGAGKVALGNPPSEPEKDWVVLLTKK